MSEIIKANKHHFDNEYLVKDYDETRILISRKKYGHNYENSIFLNKSDIEIFPLKNGYFEVHISRIDWEDNYEFFN